jgi:carboxymethylenebutenolidase
MQEGFLEIRTAAGRMPTFYARPAKEPAPPVILFMDVWGVRPELHDIARRVAGRGYYCLVPDLYYRLGLRFEARDAEGRVISVNRLEKPVQAKMEDAILKTPNGQVMEDTAALLEHLENDPAALRGAVGAFGYCMGGRHALCAATRFPENFQAIASLHGTLLISDKPDSPHRAMEQVRAEIYCGFGEEDPHTPPALIAQLETLARRHGVEYRHAVHPGASHGYALPERDVYDHAATERDWQAILAMFDRRLRRSPT